MFKYLLISACLVGMMPIVILAYKKELLNTTTLKYQPLFWLVLISSIYEFIISYLLRVNSDVWFRSYILLEFLTILYFYHVLLEKKYRSFIIISLVTFVVSYIIGLLFWNKWNKMEVESYLTVLECTLIYISSLLWFRDILTSLVAKPLSALPEFYVVAGLLIYFSGTVFLFLSVKALATTAETFKSYWIINLIFNLILRILLCVSAWKVRST